MSYVDVLKIHDTIHVVERRNGKRIFQKMPAKYVFYAKNAKGTFTSIYGDSLIKFETSSFKHFQKEVRSVRPGNLFEHDINPVIRFLENNYSGAEAPNLHIAFFDIEVDFDPEIGFANPSDPYCAVNAISVYQSWTKTNKTLVLKPKTITWDQATDICDSFENTVLCQNEEELFDKFFELIDDADVLSGWNSTTFDIPYLVKRLEKIKNRDSTKRFCLWKQFPRKRTFEKFGKEQLTYDIYGRVHLDYLELYQKHTDHEMHSYSLDFVGEHETGDRKLPYEGSLDRLYKYDFKTFIEYNRQDVMLLVKIDDKNRFIDLSNQLAHDNNVLLQNTLGSVALIDQAIINEIHNQGLISPSKKKVAESITSVAGAYVANPKIGMHKWIGSVDIKSLYPSVIRALNMSPETIMGQFRLDRTMEIVKNRMESGMNAADTWADFFGVIEYQLIQDQNYDEITLDLEDGDSVTNSAKVWHDTIYTDKSGICLSANGTLFRTDTKGIIPKLLERWYNERVQIRREAADLVKEEEVLREKRLKLAATGHKDMLEPINLEIEELKKGIAFRDKRQHIKKILLNSLYGALLNPHCRFFDQRMGQSVTLTGRCITKHMISKMNELFTGEYDHEGKAILYSDTDSAYVSAVPAFEETDFEWNKENVMELYNIAADQMNETFPFFMLKTFNVSKERGSIIQANREICATSGIFIKKKRYALLCYDIDGRRFDVGKSPGKIKAMGVDMKRSDTPKVIQDFLSEILMLTLCGSSEQEVMEYVRKFRKQFREWPGWKKGTPKRVNALTKQVEMERTLGRVNMAGHQRAAMNWNNLKQMHGDNYSMEIQDGFKIIVCKLLPNPLKLVSVAYPIDQEHLPEWFKELPFDHNSMEDKLIDSKLKNLVGVLKWTLKRPEDDTTFDSLFS